MKRQKYVFNPATLSYEKEHRNFSSALRKGLGYLSAVLFTSLILFVLAYKYLPTPKEKALMRDISQMEFYYNDILKEMDQVNSEIENIQEKDKSVHRVVFGVDPIDDGIWNGGTGGRENIIRLRNHESAEKLLSAALIKVDQLKHKVRIQNNSLDTLISIAKIHETKIASIPSIKPVREDKLKRNVHLLSGYGMRIHPVHKVRKMHHGIDFTAPKGTAIQATGNGKVVKIENRRNGYGNSVVIDHGFGFTTLYGHMNTVDVKVGQRVVKGEKIGTVGSSGTSTAPHCHYEVRINGNAIDPIDYCLDGLTPLEYQALVNQSKLENQSFD
jgi:hypothetical protein